MECRCEENQFCNCTISQKNTGFQKLRNSGRVQMKCTPPSNSAKVETKVGLFCQQTHLLSLNFFHFILLLGAAPFGTNFRNTTPCTPPREFCLLFSRARVHHICFKSNCQTCKFELRTDILHGCSQLFWSLSWWQPHVCLDFRKYVISICNLPTLPHEPKLKSTYSWPPLRRLNDDVPKLAYLRTRLWVSEFSTKSKTDPWGNVLMS